MGNGFFEKGWLTRLFANDVVLAFFVAAVLLVTIVVQYRFEAFYTQKTDAKNTRNMDGHPLNVKYGFKKRRDLDVKKINLYIMFAHLIAITVGLIVMLAWQVFAGFIVYFVLSVSGELLAVHLIGTHPEWVTYKRNKQKQPAGSTSKKDRKKH